MLAGEFERKLRQLNSDLRVFCGEDRTKAAGVYKVARDEYSHKMGTYQHLCGCDKGFIGRFPEWHEDGRIKHSGWQRILRYLISQRIVRREKAQRVFCVDLSIGHKMERPLPKEAPHELMDRFRKDTSLKPGASRIFVGS